MKIFKKLIKKSLNTLGLDINRINNAKNKEINQANSSKEFALNFNSLKEVDNWYSQEKHADDYLSSDRLLFYKKLINLTIKEGINLDGKNILDIGCGPGALLSEVKKESRNANLTGIDFSEHAIKYAKKIIPDIKFEAKDILKDNFEEKYDVIFCTEVLEHVEHPELVLSKILGLVNVGGTVILSVPNGRLDTFIGHINFWSPESWKIFIKKYCLNCEVKTYLINNNIHNVAIITKK